MRVLITGSSGQIGTNLALTLMQRGDTVTGIDKRPNAWTDTIDYQTLDLIDLTRGQAKLELDARPDVVVHLAAHAKVYELVKNPARALENIEMLFGVLEYCRRQEIPIIFASSREVYGDIHRWITDESVADFVVAESPYSASKISGEAMVYSYYQCYKLPHLVFRFSNVYGRYDCDLERMERVIPLFIRRIAQDQPIKVFGAHKVLDFTFIDDCIAGIIAGIDRVVSGEITHKTINLAYGHGNSLEDLVNIIGLALNKEPQAEYLSSRSGEVTRYVADITVARNLLNYSPQVPLSAGLRRAIKWQQQIGVI
ncbi:NAD-dependent epimerase/dehydratase family protein [candidate division KSB1 bacterium]|nr:NAD-dependent epimerase/dehydratase family protein [candidate division KSB1 bacterium]